MSLSAPCVISRAAAPLRVATASRACQRHQDRTNRPSPRSIHTSTRTLHHKAWPGRARTPPSCRVSLAILCLSILTSPVVPCKRDPERRQGSVRHARSQERRFSIGDQEGLLWSCEEIPSRHKQRCLGQGTLLRRPISLRDALRSQEERDVRSVWLGCF